MSRRNRRRATASASPRPAPKPDAPAPALVEPVAAAPATAPQPTAEPPVSDHSTRTLAQELRTLVDGLLWLSESEAPLLVLELPQEAILPDALRTLTGLPPEAPAEEWSVADMISPATAPSQPDAARFVALQEFLETKLTRASVYKLGADVKKHVFFVGRQPDKSWLGMQTQVVET